ncbi:MAG: ubiquinone biosynthesis regulatory protein kinase UbiB [Pseudomonadales bacterium]|nr:ubiquinone biosynthesis regulatory protein kinase UbiB [Pseudomonadales bacterium]
MRIWRVLRILWVVIRRRLDRLIPPQAKLPRRLGLMIWLLRCMPVPSQSPSTSLRLALEELGPIFVKFGQLLSTRRDLLSEPLADELQRLQEQVPPFPGQEARAILEMALGAPVSTLFQTFKTEPLASASVAQVHEATLRDGSPVVIKVIRPGIDIIVQEDLKVLYLLADLVNRFSVDGRRLRPVDVVHDYENVISGELNLNLEATNTIRLREYWLDSGKLYVPRVYSEFTRNNVLVMERIQGLTSADIQGLHRRNVNMKVLAHLGVEIFFTQVFEHNFFHADMHPGNVYIDTSDSARPTYIALDCAIIGSLTEEDKDYLAYNLIAFFRRDYREVARLHIESGWVPAETDLQEFEAVIRSVCDPYFQKPISQISFGQVLLALFNTARQFDMEIQPQLVLLQKTLLNIEGMGRQIYPELDLWETAAPFMERWMSERVGLRGLVRQLSEHGPALIEQLPRLPTVALTALQDMASLAQISKEQTQVLRALQQDINAERRQRRQGRTGGVLLLAALASLLIPATGYAANEWIIGSSLLGSAGIYWMFVKP